MEKWGKVCHSARGSVIAKFTICWIKHVLTEKVSSAVLEKYLFTFCNTPVLKYNSFNKRTLST